MAVALCPDWPHHQRMPSAIELRIEGRAHDLGGFQVRRVLPTAKRQMVGPFIFVDHMGPAVFAPGQGVEVRPHPHIGLATVTWLFEGAMVHRDSLGYEQVIVPGDVNWMTAGRGISHSERSRPGDRAAGHRVHGMQTWVALPAAHEEDTPTFAHHAAESLPSATRGGVRLVVVAGSAFGLVSPARTYSPTLYVALEFAAGSELGVDVEHAERALYVAEGSVAVDGEDIAAGTLAVFAAGRPVSLRAATAARAMLLGGAPMDGRRFIWWNYVSSTKERIERAKADWREGRIPLPPGETEFIPLPAR